jgi:hypothetical protein
MSNTLTRKNDPYLLCEKRCRDLCIYLNAVTRNMPKYEKYVLSAKIRDCGYTLVELAICARFKFYKKTDLTKLNIQKEMLKQYLQLAYDCGHTNLTRYRRSLVLLDDVGKQLSCLLSIGE